MAQTRCLIQHPMSVVVNTLSFCRSDSLRIVISYLLNDQWLLDLNNLLEINCRNYSAYRNKRCNHHKDLGFIIEELLIKIRSMNKNLIQSYMPTCIQSCIRALSNLLQYEYEKYIYALSRNRTMIVSRNAQQDNPCKEQSKVIPLSESTSKWTDNRFMQPWTTPHYYLKSILCVIDQFLKRQMRLKCF